MAEQDRNVRLTAPSLPIARPRPGDERTDVTTLLPAVAVMTEPESATAFDVRAAARDLCRPVWVCDLSDPAMAVRQRAYARFGPVVDTAGRSPAAVASELRDLGVAGVVAYTDRPLPYAADLAAHLGVPFHPPAVAAALTDKHLQRTLLARRGVPSARSVLVEHGAPIPDDLPLPAVVKPRRGAGSRAVSFAATDAELRAALAAADEDMLVEEFLVDAVPREQQTDRADMVSVEAYVSAGTPSVVAVSQRWPLGRPWRETGSYFPAAPDDGCTEVALAAVAALGVRDGFVHVEVKRTPTGPRIVEVNGRLGGMVSELHQLAGGTNLMRQALALALGRRVETSSLDRIGVLLWVYPPDGAAVVVAVHGLDAVRAMDGVEDVRLKAHPGAVVDWSRGNLAHAVEVRASVADVAAAAALRRAVLETVRVDAS